MFLVLYTLYQDIYFKQDDKKFYQLELVNRETGFSKVFNSSANVGVINPLIKVSGCVGHHQSVQDDKVRDCLFCSVSECLRMFAHVACVKKLMCCYCNHHCTKHHLWLHKLKKSMCCVVSHIRNIIIIKCWPFRITVISHYLCGIGLA